MTRTERGYELQFRMAGREERWTSMFGSGSGGVMDETFIRNRYIKDAAQDYDASDDLLNEHGQCEWRIVRVLEEVVEPPRTSQQVVEWYAGEDGGNRPVNQHRRDNPGHSSGRSNTGSLYCVDCAWVGP